MSDSPLHMLLLAQAENSPGALTQLAPIILLFVGFWFLIIAPQRKRQKQHDEMVRGLKTGDEIITSGGIFGTITNVKEDRLVVRIADNTKVEVGRTAVQAKVSKQAE